MKNLKSIIFIVKIIAVTVLFYVTRLYPKFIQLYIPSITYAYQEGGSRD